jgi:hypothetical protein
MPRTPLYVLLFAACGADTLHPMSDAGSKTDAATVSAQTLGSPCTCTSSDCDSFGVPEPPQGDIKGCDQVPTNWPGGLRACMRSYDGALATGTYFANGYCDLMASTCTGSNTVCGSAVFGDYDQMVACPSGSVMLQDTTQVSVLGQNATVMTKLCVQKCTATGQCRETETDPVWSAPTQEQCNDKAGVKFCYDPRNLSAAYTATAF